MRDEEEVEAGRRVSESGEIRSRESGKLLEFVIRSRVRAIESPDRKGSPVRWGADLGAACGWSASQVSTKVKAPALEKASAVRTIALVQSYLDAHEVPTEAPRTDLLTYFRMLTGHSIGGLIEVPATFIPGLVRDSGPATEEELVVWGAALVSARQRAGLALQAQPILQRLNGDEGEGPVDRVIALMVDQLTVPSNYSSLLIRQIAELKEWALPHIEATIYASPAGWLAIRPVVYMLAAQLPDNAGAAQRADRETLVLTTRELLRRVVTDPEVPPALDPARGFLEEALRAAPAGPGGGWSREWNFAREHLEKLAFNEDSHFRLRGFAAMCLASRPDTREVARAAADRMRGESGEDPANPLTRVSRVVSSSVRQQESGSWVPFDDETSDYVRGVLNGWAPSVDGEPKDVAAAAGLIRRSLLFTDTALRRRCCETLVAAGLADACSELVAGVVGDVDAPLLVRDQAAVVLGFFRSAGAAKALAGAATESLGTQRSALMAMASLRGDPSGATPLAVESAMSSANPMIVASAVYASANRGWIDLDTSGKRVDLAERLVAATAGATNWAVTSTVEWAAHLLTSTSPVPALTDARAATGSGRDSPQN